jgi:photosystem II stability/assembly factor-like uncharacterized protein
MRPTSGTLGILLGKRLSLPQVLFYSQRGEASIIAVSKSTMRSLMKKFPLIPAFLVFLGIIVSLQAQVPQLINYQGRVAVNGANFDGSGQFKFALVNADGTTTYWSNDGTSTGGNAPTNAVSLTVTKGLYSILLGDATVANMTVVPSTVFNNSDVRLRVWFNDGSTGWQQLTPDQRIAAVGYAMMAGSVADGSITTAKIASGAVGTSQIALGAVGSEQLATGAVQAINIAAGAIGSSQLASGTVPAPQNVAGTSQTAAPNTSYVVAGNSTTTFTLPAIANVGDRVQISGAGAGWQVGSDWTARATTQYWSGIASSSDGTKLAATARAGQIYTSTDSGATWTVRASSQNWSGITSSSDGTKLAATVSGGQIYASTDSGVTWTARATTQNWKCIASSSDGTKLAAYGSQIWTSVDSGVTWTARANSPGCWRITSSSDGTKLAAVVAGGQIYTSTDSGVTWTARASSQNWRGIASSSDGTKLAAVAIDYNPIYTSTDSGATWTAVASSLGNLTWGGIASSSDGTKLAAVSVKYSMATSDTSQIYTSADSGASWTAVASSRDRVGVDIASSSDGTKLAACDVDLPGQIHTGTNNPFSAGSAGTTGTFQYVGNGRWVRVVQAP